MLQIKSDCTVTSEYANIVSSALSFTLMATDGDFIVSLISFCRVAKAKMKSYPMLKVVLYTPLIMQFIKIVHDFL